MASGGDRDLSAHGLSVFVQTTNASVLQMAVRIIFAIAHHVSHLATACHRLFDMSVLKSIFLAGNSQSRDNGLVFFLTQARKASFCLFNW